MSAPSFEQAFGKDHTLSGFAPGRIEFLGNHTDYNGGTVLGVAIDRGITTTIAPSDSSTIEIFSSRDGSRIQSDINNLVKLEGDAVWGNYILGVADQLIKAGMKPEHGFLMSVDSNLPDGAGLSSSAALELSACVTITGLYKHPLEKKGMAMICRKAENDFVGLPCGILDQGVSAFGRENGLVSIDCHTNAFDIHELPPEVNFWVFDSGVKHALLDSFYEKRNKECHEVYDLLETCGAEAPCLAQIDSVFVKEHEAMLGDDLYKRALHVTEENERVLLAIKRLADGDVQSTGKLLNASHESSSKLFENSTEELDYLVSLLQQIPSVFGARLTGGGFGGAVMAMTNEAFSEVEAREHVSMPFAQKYGQDPAVLKLRASEGAHLVKE